MSTTLIKALPGTAMRKVSDLQRAVPSGVLVGRASSGDGPAEYVKIHSITQATNFHDPNGIFVPPHSATTQWNPADTDGSVTWTLTTTNVANDTAEDTANPMGAARAGIRSNTFRSNTNGKVYFEMHTYNVGSSGEGFGLAKSSFSLTTGIGASTDSVGITNFSSPQLKFNGSLIGSALSGAPYSNVTYGFAVDFINGLIWAINWGAPANGWNGSPTADPALGTGGLSISQLSSGNWYLCLATNNLHDVLTLYSGAGTGWSGSGPPSGFAAWDADIPSKAGTVPAPVQADVTNNAFMRADGNWANVWGQKAGTPYAEPAQYKLAYSQADGTLAALSSVGTTTTLLHGGSPNSYSAVSLTADVTGVLPSANIVDTGTIPRWVTAPAHNNSTGTTGQIAQDGSFFYVCTATNTWARVAIGGAW